MQGVLELSGTITALAHAAATEVPARFRHQALVEVRRQVSFESAIWGTAAIGQGLRFRDVALFNLPEDAATDAEASSSADPRLLQVLGAPGTSIAYSIGPDDPETLRRLTALHRIEHIMSIAHFDAELGLASGLVLTRTAQDRPFDDAECRFIEAAFPHLLRFWTENQIGSLSRDLVARKEGLRHVAVGRQGVLAAAESEFLDWFRREWPNWQGPRLPADVQALLDGADGGIHLGREIVLKVAHATDVSLLQVRLRSVVDDLSPRERQVAELCATGNSYREIAELLGIAPTTARNHIAAIHRRLGVGRNSEIGALLAQTS
jgi:DNA-binding CsgD family transcriptional regulator